MANALSEIRMMTSLGYGGASFSKGDVVKVGSGKESVDAKTAESWVRAGLAISTEPQEGPDLSAKATKVVVHERGGMELLQGMSTVEAGGGRHGPAEENVTDSDPEADAEAGATRTAAGAVIAENADPVPVAKAGKKGKK